MIDKELIKQEIEKEMLLLDRTNTYDIGRLDELNHLSLFVDTLEVKEVDLEKEIKEFILDEWCDEWSDDIGNWIRCCRGSTSMTVEDVKVIAKHFFELGLKARKDLELTRKDMAEIIKIADLLEIEWLNSTPWDGIRDWGFYAEVLTRYKAQKRE